jgi:hypothetical protein
MSNNLLLRKWQVHMAHPHLCYSISLVPGYHSAKLNLEPAKGRYRQ